MKCAKESINDALINLSGNLNTKFFQDKLLPINLACLLSGNAISFGFTKRCSKRLRFGERGIGSKFA
jgi:hypothetical protein